MNATSIITATISTAAVVLSLDAPLHAGKTAHKAGSGAKSEPSELAPQSTCPVMGGEIEKELYADHDGKRVYFCCEGCIGEFNKDPETYLGKLNEAGQKPKSLASAGAQTTCPVMGGAINKELYADYQGKRVYFCCGGCKGPFEEDPEKYLKKLRESGQEPEAIPN